MKKLAVLNSFAVLLIFSVALMLFSGPAQAYVYDNFTSTGINPSLWYPNGPTPGLFSQPGNGDTYLHYSDSGGENQGLRSYNQVSGAFFVSMQYSDFNATTNQPSGVYKSTLVELMLAYSGRQMIVSEGKNTDYQFFQALTVINNTPTGLVTVHPVTVTSGWLGLGYNGISGSGGQVSFWYNDGTVWTALATYAPDFSSDPYFLIQGHDPYGTSLSFKVDQVQVLAGSQSPVPLPPSFFLLGSGLLSLPWWGRKFRKG